MTQPATQPQLSGKISFAVDYINLLGLMNLRAKGGINPIAHSAILLFLVDWGLTAAELDQANEIFWQRVESKTIDNFDMAAKRIAKALQPHPAEQRRMITQLAAIAELDADLTAEEIGYMKSWGETFDMRPSEIGGLYDRGRQLALALTFFGRKFMDVQMSLAASGTDEAATPPPDSAPPPAEK